MPFSAHALQPQLKKILVVKNRAMGDSLMGLSTLDFIRSLHPKATVYYAIPKWIVPLYKQVHCAADHVIGIDLSRMEGWLELWSWMLSANIDYVYEMHLAGRSQKFFRLYNKLHGIGYGYHNHHLKSGTVIHDQGQIKPLIQRDLDGAWSCMTDRSMPVPNYLNYPPKLRLAQAGIKRKRLVFGSVATRETKLWPIPYFVALAQKLLATFPELEIAVPLSRSSFDQKIKSEFEKLNMPKGLSFVHLDLSQLPKFMAESLMYIGNDTGLKHLAVAVGTKNYTLFGPEPPLEWHPYDPKDAEYFFIHPLECRTRTAHYCGLHHCDSMICLNSITPDTVLARVQDPLEAMLKNAPAF